ncbi:DNA ligase D [Rhizobacter sp. SG703]|uniref:DNA ligase D n=1 Tax=Rhizobacter sp. SG703 TaxID=2587140 RepID=UPI001446989F|nr:DNA ligase D [Rhizobacter sp. SG703]NKI92362.1 bifunctional non-homologous end joining protein LigD [Rhizobacter sp. SG703]
MARNSTTAHGSTAADPLHTYWSKRDFSQTPEPRGEQASAGDALAFVVQKHDATRLHYDFRLELDGVMLSWAVPKGPSFDPSEKRLAVRTEDHPVSYNSFEGRIPEGHYGAGDVIIWDRGTWQPVGDPKKGLAAGKIAFTLDGEKLHGAWELVRMRGAGSDKQPPWLLLKKKDGFARPHAEYDVVSALPDSVGPGGDAKARPKPKPERQERPLKAVKAPLPATMTPQLATLASGVPADGDWGFEIKFDGYRIMTRIQRGKPVLITRGGHDWSDRLPTLVAALRQLDVTSAWLDGEIVVLGDDGLPAFNRLQNAFDGGNTAQVAYFLFDLPYLEGHDLRELPLRERRRLLKQLLEAKGSGPLRFSEDFPADAASVLQSACRLKLEGVIAKRQDAPYVSRRTEDWLKLKCQQRQEFVIGGYTDRRGERDGAHIGSLLLGVHDDDGTLRSVGSVGTGWDSAMAAELKTKLLKLQADASPFATAPKPGRGPRGAQGERRWVKPTLMAEVSFGEWTPDGQIRHASFEGLRTDKPAKRITRERAVAVKTKATASTSMGTSAKTRAATKVTHPERVIDKSTGLTKLDLVRYYESVAERMLPHLKGRPCALMRAPEGVGGEQFFQKHAGKMRFPGMRELDPALWPEHEPLLEVPSATALAGAAQMNVIEFHTWNALARRIDKPDRMVFDLDPGEGVEWAKVREAAALVRSLLQALGLESWLKTSGGKGLHVVVPLKPQHGWDAVKGFSQAIVQHMAQVVPERFVAKSGPANRVGKIFVDYLRNGHNATTAAAFSARARPGLGVSMPVPWEALDELKGGNQWTIKTALDHLSFEREDPWKDYWTTKQPIGKAMQRLGFKPVSGKDKG